MKVLDDAISLFEKQQYEEAFSIFLPLANDNNPIAMYYIGLCFRKGCFVEEDQKEAFRWFLKSAEQGHSEAQYLIGLAYLHYSGLYGGTESEDDFPIHFQDIEISVFDHNVPYYFAQGIGVEPNDEKALMWFLRASEKNHAKAQYELGKMYQGGNVVAYNDDQAIKWFEISVNQKNSNAALGLARIYEYQKKEDLAIEWYEKAIDLGSKEAPFRLGSFYEISSKKSHDLSKAFKWYKYGSEKYNDYRSQQRLARLYKYGLGIEQNTNEALKWYMKSAEQNSEGACYVLGILYFFGSGVEKSHQEAIKWFIRSADHYHESAERMLKRYHRNGFSINRKYNDKFDLYLKAQSGDKDAQIEFANKYLYNQISDLYQKEARQWFDYDAKKEIMDAQFLYAQIFNYRLEKQEYINLMISAAKQGHREAQYILARHYHNGDYVDINYSEAMKWYQQAAISNMNAQIDLGYIYGNGILSEIEYHKAYIYYQMAMKQFDNLDVKRKKTVEFIKLRYNAANDEAEELALNGDVDAQLYMGCLYQYGFEVKRNKNKAIYWYEMAKKQGSDEAQLQLNLLNKDLD